MNKLMEYLPSYYNEVEEIEYLLDAEDPEIRALWESIKRVKNNQFILSADNETIKKWESLLNIYRDKNEKLEDRKLVVLARLLERSPYTERQLRQILSLILGNEDNYTLEIKHETFEVNIEIKLVAKKHEQAVNNMLYSYNIIPCNMIINISLIYNNYESLKDFNLTYADIKEMNIKYIDLKNSKTKYNELKEVVLDEIK